MTDFTQLTGDLSLARLGKPNGFASLTPAGKIPASQIPSGVSGGLTFIGLWDANTNTPDLTTITPTNGDLYIVSVEGSQDLNGEGVELFTLKDSVFWSETEGVWYHQQGTTVAEEVLFNNSASGLVAGNTQDAIDELDGRVDTVETTLDYININSTETAASAIGTDAIAIGPDLSLEGANNICVGQGITSNSFSSGNIALGNLTTVIQGDNNVCIGRNVRLTSGNKTDGILIGRGANAGTSNSVGFGDFICIGRNTTAESIGGIAIGADSSISGGSYCMAIGRLANSTGGNSISLGPNTVSSSNFTIALGFGAVASSFGAVQIGSGTNNVSNTLKYGNNIIANTEGLYTSHDAVYYNPVDDDNVTSHFAAIDIALANKANVATVDSLSDDIEDLQESVVFIPTVNEETLTANKTLLSTDAKIQVISTSGDNRQITLPDSPVGTEFKIMHNDTNSGFTLTVRPNTQGSNIVSNVLAEGEGLTATSINDGSLSNAQWIFFRHAAGRLINAQ